MTTFQLQHPERLWMAASWLGLVLLLLLWGYRGSRMTMGKRLLAMLCKVLAAALLGACLLDPVSVNEVPRKGENEILVLADNSASLMVAEQSGGTVRAEQLKSLLAGKGAPWAAWMESLRDAFRVRLQAVDDRVRGIENASALDFKGDRSTLCSAVMAARDRRSASVAAVVILSDGNATDAENWKAEAGGAPVFPVLIGDKAPARDLAVREVTSTQSAFEDAPVQITAKVSQVGYTGKEVALCVLDEAGKILSTDKRKFGEREDAYVFRARVPLVKPGVSLLRVVCVEGTDAAHPELALAATPGTEATMVNNVRWLSVDRGAGPYRILYVAGRPNWEHKFLRRAMALDTEVQLPSIIRIAKREPKFEFLGRAGETSNPLFRGFAGEQQGDAQRYDQPVLVRVGTKDKTELVDGFPKSAELLMGEYRAIILDDLEAEFFTQEQMNLIEKFVSARGGSLLMLGGADSFQSGGYDNTPVGRMLPVYLDKMGDAAPMENAKFALTREGWLEPWLRVRTEQTADEQRVAQMPSFYSVNPSSSIKPGAVVMATLTNEAQHQVPAIATQRYGSGRVAAMMIGDFWRWGMVDPEHHAEMDKTWRQILRWMITDVPDRIELQAALSQVGGQQVAKLTARVRDAAFRPQDDANVQFDLTPPKQTAATSLYAEPSLKEPGAFESEYYPRADGGYRIKAQVKDGAGKLIGEKTTGFALNMMAEEMTALAPNRALMQRMAKETGGEVIEAANIQSLAERLPKLEMPSSDRKTQPLWHNVWWLLAVVGLLAAEWLIRRTQGVV